MADENVENLGLNLSVENAEKFIQETTAAQEAMDKFTASGDKLVEVAPKLESAFNLIVSSTAGIKAALAGDFSGIKAFTDQLSTTLQGLGYVREKAASATKAAIVPAIGPGPATPTTVRPGESVTADIGGEMKKEAEQVNQATQAISTSFADMNAKASAQVNELKSAMKQVEVEASKVGTQVASSFKTSFDVVMADHLRTLERSQRSARDVVQGATITPEEKLGARETVDIQAAAEMAKYKAIVKEATDAIAVLRLEQKGLTIEDERFATILTEISDKEKLATNELRLLSTESGTYSDHLKEQIRLMSAANKENVGAKSTLSPTRGDALDAGAKSLIYNIAEKTRRAQEAAQATQAQVEAERLAADQMVAIQNVLNETTGRSAEYRKAKLREVLEVTIASSRDIINSAKEVNAAQKAALSEEQQVAAARDRLMAQAAEQGRIRSEAIRKGFLSGVAGKTVASEAEATMKAELAQIEAQAKSTLTNFSEQALRQFRAFRTELQANTRDIQAQVTKQSMVQGPSLASQARKGFRDDPLRLDYDHMSAAKFQQGLVSQNEMIRTIYQSWAKVIAVIVEVRYYAEFFSRVLAGIKYVIDSSILAPIKFIFAPLNALIALVQKVQGFVGKSGDDLSGLGKAATSLVSPKKMQATPETTTGPPGSAKEQIISVKADTRQAKTALEEMTVVAREATGPKLVEVKANTAQAVAGLESLKTKAVAVTTKIAETGAQIQVLAAEKNIAASQVASGAGSAAVVEELSVQIRKLTNDHNRLKLEQQAIQQVSKATEQALGGEAMAAKELAVGLETAGKSADIAKTKISTLDGTLKGGLIEGIGQGISSMLLMSVTMGIQNAIFSIGRTITDAFRSAFAVVDEMVKLTGVLQKDIMNTKGYENLAQAESEATAKAQELYSWIERLSIVSPFKKDELISLFQLGIDFGFTAQGAQVLTQSLTDFATVSHSGIKGAEGIINVLGTMRETGLVTAKVIKTLGKEGLDVMPILEKEFGMSAAGINKALKQQQLDAKRTIEAIVASIQKDYGGQAAKAGGTVPGLLSSIIDLRDKLLAISIEPVMESIAKPILLFIASVGQTQEVAAIFDRIGQSIKAFAVNVEKFLFGAFYLLKNILDAIPQPLKDFWDAWGKVYYVFLAVGAAMLIIPPILTGIAFAIGLLLTPLSLIEAALAVVYMGWKKNFMGMRDITDQLVDAVAAAWSNAINGGFARALDYLYGWYESFIGIVEGIMLVLDAAFSFTRLAFISGNIFGLVQQIDYAIGEYLGQRIKESIDAAIEAISQLPAYLSSAAQNILDVLQTVPEGFAQVMREVVEYGTAIVRFFAQGIVQAAHYVVEALGQIGSIITEWLSPHSPPKLLPNLETWGKTAADIYFKGWTKADMSMFTELSGMMEKAVGAIRPDGVLPSGIKRIRETFASAIQGYKQTGTLDETGLRDVGGRFNNEIISLTHAYIDAAKAARNLEAAQDLLKTTTDAYDKRLAPLQARLKAIQETMSSFDITTQIKELNYVLSNQFATGDQKAQAQAKIDELNLQKQINALDAEKNSRTAAIQERINLATKENATAQEAMELLKERFDQEISIIALQNKKSGGGSDASEREKKPPKEKKPKLEPVVNTDQPELGAMDLPALDTSGMGSLADIIANAKKNMNSAFSGVKDALKPAIDALDNLKSAVKGVADAFASGFSGGEGGALSGVKLFAFNLGTYVGMAWLTINGFITSVTGFAAKFIEAFNLTPGGVGEKILGALNATLVVPAVESFVSDLLLAPLFFTIDFLERFTITPGSIFTKISAALDTDKPTTEEAIARFRSAVLAAIDAGGAFASTFVEAFTITNGSILAKFTAALDATGVTGAIDSFKLKVFSAIKEAFGGEGQGEHGRGGGATVLGIDLSFVGQTIVDGIAAFDFKGKLDALKTNVKAALDLLFGAGTGDKAEGAAASLALEVQAKLDLLFGTVSFSDLTTSFTNLVTGVKDTITKIKWKKPLDGVFDGLKDAVIGSFTALFSLGKGDLKGAKEGTDQASQGVGEMAGGTATLIASVTDAINQSVDFNLVLGAIGVVLATGIGAAIQSVDQIVAAIAGTKQTEGKDEATLSQTIGESVGKAITGTVVGIFAFLATVDYKAAIDAAGATIANLTIVLKDLVVGIIKGTLDGIFDAVSLLAPGWKTTIDKVKTDTDAALAGLGSIINKILDWITNKNTEIKQTGNSEFLGNLQVQFGMKDGRTKDDDAFADVKAKAAAAGVESSTKFWEGWAGNKSTTGTGSVNADAFAPIVAAAKPKGLETSTSYWESFTSYVAPPVEGGPLDVLAATAKPKGTETASLWAEGVHAGATEGLTGITDLIYKALITDPLASLGIKSPSTVADQQLGYPTGQGITQGTARALKDGGDLMAGTKTAFATAYSAIKASTDKFSTTLKKTFADMYTALLKATDKFFKDMLKAWEDFKKAVIKLAQEIRDGVNSAFDDMRKNAIADFDAIKTTGIGDFTTLKRDVVALVESMDKAIVDELETLNDKIAATLKGVLDSLSAPGGVKDKFRDFGTDLGNTFAAALTAALKSSSNVSSATEAATDLGNAIRAAATKAADPGTTPTPGPTPAPGGGGIPNPTGNVQGASVTAAQSGDLAQPGQVSTFLSRLVEGITKLVAQQSDTVKSSAYAPPSTNLMAPASTNKTYILQMAVTQGQLENVVTNYAIFESLAG